MEFKKFTSLENTYRQNIIDKVVNEFKDNQTWVVTEKLDGANFAFYYNGEDLQVASRNQFVDGTFYNCQQVINKYQEHIKQIFDYCDGYSLIVRGELFGQGVQKRVEYGTLDFRVFEIVVNEEIQPFTSTNKILKMSKRVFEYDLSKQLEMVPVVLITDSFKEALEVNETFSSYFTPESFEGDNFAEGFAIQPNTPSWFNNGTRIWFKKKSEKFSEYKKGKTTKTVVELSENDKILFNDIVQYNTESRVISAISKFGKPKQNDFGKILGEVMRDLIEDFNKENETDIKVTVENWKKFNSELNKEVSKTVREEFIKHLN